MLKNVAIQAANEAEYKRINTDVNKKDMIQYKQFPWLINPNSSFFQKFFGIIFNWIGLLTPFFNIYFFNNLFNLLFRSVKLNTQQKSRREVKSTPDRRYKTGRRVIGRRVVTYYEKDKDQPYIVLTQKELNHNRIWSIVFIVLIGLAIYSTYDKPEFTDFISYVITGALLGAIWSLIRSYFVNKKGIAI